MRVNDGRHQMRVNDGRHQMRVNDGRHQMRFNDGNQMPAYTAMDDGDDDDEEPHQQWAALLLYAGAIVLAFFLGLYLEKATAANQAAITANSLHTFMAPIPENLDTLRNCTLKGCSEFVMGLSVNDLTGALNSAVQHFTERTQESVAQASWKLWS